MLFFVICKLSRCLAAFPPVVSWNPTKEVQEEEWGKNLPLVLWTEQFSVPVINLLPPNILPCPLPEIREDKDSVKMRALGDKSSNEIRCLCLYFAKRRDAHFKSLRASAGSDPAVKTRAVGLEGSVQISRFALCILTVTELSLRSSQCCWCLSPLWLPRQGAHGVSSNQ